MAIVARIGEVLHPPPSAILNPLLGSSTVHRARPQAFGLNWPYAKILLYCESAKKSREIKKSSFSKTECAYQAAIGPEGYGVTEGYGVKPTHFTFLTK